MSVQRQESCRYYNLGGNNMNFGYIHVFNNQNDRLYDLHLVDSRL